MSVYAVQYMRAVNVYGPPETIEKFHTHQRLSFFLHWGLNHCGSLFYDEVRRHVAPGSGCPRSNQPRKRVTRIGTACSFDTTTKQINKGLRRAQ